MYYAFAKFYCVRYYTTVMIYFFELKLLLAVVMVPKTMMA